MLGRCLAAGDLPDDPKLRVLLQFARDLTKETTFDFQEAVRHLISVGWSDAAIHDAAQVIGYFNYVNRLAQGLGVELESRWSESQDTP